MPGRSGPNIVFILVDNVGWGDWGVYGGATPTPRIDALAAEGIRFSNYTVESQCTPTRSAILTGRLPVRSGTFTVPLPGQGDYGLPTWEYTLAELLADAGYATAAFGKWHLGEVDGRLPTDRGFDEWWGIKNSSDEAGYTSYAVFRSLHEELGLPIPQIWEAKRGEPAKPVRALDLEVRPLLDELIVERASAYIDERAAAVKPFFAYVALTHVHPPERVHPDFDQTSPERGGLYADLMAEMDHRVGQILDALDRAGVADDTVVVLSSDNSTGGPRLGFGGSTGPWRGDFMSPPFEGSMRAPAIVRWPGRIPAGVVSGEMLSAVDWLPTLAGLAGESDRVPDDRPVDGRDASAFLLGQSQESGRQYVLFFGPDGELMSVKWRSIKVIFRYTEGIDQPIVKPHFPLVYDLSSDPGERFNLFDTKLDMGWMFAPAFMVMAEFQESVRRHRHIQPGEEFEGYPRELG